MKDRHRIFSTDQQTDLVKLHLYIDQYICLSFRY
jgi:hypothetical protein